MKKEQILQRCGYCGRYYAGADYIYSEQIGNFSAKELDEAPLGYCPNAEQEHFEQNPPTDY